MDGLKMIYFVLKPSGLSPYAAASRKAMLRYANEIGGENPILAKELREWVLKETPQASPEAVETLNKASEEVVP